jgi:hypothetical protein
MYKSDWKESMKIDDDEVLAPPYYIQPSVGTTFSITTFSISYEYIKRKNSVAATFFQLLAFYHRSDFEH